MAKRKRLNPLELGGASAPALETKAMGRPPAAGIPPIARVAGESAGGGERALAMAEEAGRLVHAIALSRIDMFHLSRDRMKSSDDGMSALRNSIAAHGQRVPIEVMETGNPEYPFGLISGYRRMRALMDLERDHPGDARFASVRAFVRRPDDLRGAYIAMVEENEIREDISHFERARVALMATRSDVFDSVEQAVDVLYAAGSKARRSKIRSFVGVVEVLGDVLVWPQAVGERLGLRLAEAIRAGQGDRLARALETGDFHDAAGQNAVLEAMLKDRRTPAGARKPAPVSRTKPLFEQRLKGGAQVTLHRTGGISRLEIAGHELTPHQAQILTGALEMLLENGGD